MAVTYSKIVLDIVEEIWRDLNGRSGFDLGALPRDVQREIKTAWKSKIKKVLDKVST